MRVAHFVQRYPPALGGSEAYFARLSRHLADQGAEVMVFTTTALDLSAFWSPAGQCLSAGVAEEDGVTVRRFPLWRMWGRRYLLKPLSLLPPRWWQCMTMPCNPISWPMWRAAHQRQPRFDVVHATAFPYAWPIVCGLRLARRQGIPFLLTPFLHLGDPANPADRTRRAYLSPALRWLVRQADRIFVQTEMERAALLDEHIAAEKIVLLGMGVEPADCTGGDRQRARQQWQARSDEVVLGHLANLSREKGTVDLLQAAQRAWRDGLRFRLVLAGPAMPNFEAFWRTFSPLGPVCRLGVLSAEQKRDFFAGLDVFALPSRSDSFGLVILEAWANGVPTVAYRAGGPAQVIHHQHDGWLVPCGDVASLAEALTILIPDIPRCRQLGNLGRLRALRDYRWTDKLRQVQVHYQESTTLPKAGRACKGLSAF